RHTYSIAHPYPSCLFSFNNTAHTEIYTLSLHDALPILDTDDLLNQRTEIGWDKIPNNAKIGHLHLKTSDLAVARHFYIDKLGLRSEEHTSELQSRFDLVCRLLLEKKNNKPKQSRTDATR